jgi:hypothetical protein
MQAIERCFDENPVFATTLVVMVLVAMICMVLIGRSFTPKNGEVLTPQNWKIMNSRKAYDLELKVLSVQVLELNRLLNTGQPDPIQGQIVIDAVVTQLGQLHHSALHGERKAVSVAASVVQGWLQGAESYEFARIVVNDAMQILHAAKINTY